MYKLIFLDFNLRDGMNGPETAFQMRKIFQSYEANHQTTFFTRPYICCLTAQSGKKFRDVAISNGMDNFYTKPINFTALEDLITKRNVTRLESVSGI